MRKIDSRNYLRKILSCAFLWAVILFIFTGCAKKERMPQPEFPLSEAVLMAAMEETGLSWSIEQANERTDGTATAITYALHLPQMREGYNNVAVNSYYSKELGRRLQILFHEPQNKQWWLEEDDACWEDWHEVLVLMARLYGGFEDAEEIYRACSVEELSHDKSVLWQGSLTGGYLLMMTTNPMKPKRLSMGNGVVFELYESEDAYLKFRQIAKEQKEKSDALRK